MDILIRNMDERTVAALEESARDLGISRNELIKRRLDAGTRPHEALRVEDFRRLAELAADARDPSVMDRAWRR